jgi:ABC-type glycerol-3-phosphate transport system substrate-binding protein
MMNWPFMWNAGQDPSQSQVVGKLSSAVLPAGPAGSASIDGTDAWTITKSSKNPDKARELIEFYLSADVQKRQVLDTGWLPIRLSVLADPEVQAKAPYLAQFKDVFANAVPRPSTPTRSQFPKVSKAMFNAGYDVLSGRATGEQAVADLEAKLKRIKGKEWK